MSQEAWAHEDDIGAAGTARLIFNSLQRITDKTKINILLSSKSGHTYLAIFKMHFFTLVCAGLSGFKDFFLFWNRYFLHFFVWAVGNNLATCVAQHHRNTFPEEDAVSSLLDAMTFSRVRKASKTWQRPSGVSVSSCK